MYFKRFSASSLLSKAPKEINVWVYPIRGSPIRGSPIRGSPIRGVDKTSPKAPLPLDFGIRTLYLCKFSCFSMNFSSIYLGNYIPVYTRHNI